jgi:pimeloyl-ACP methyl ester carboxylesterase
MSAYPGFLEKHPLSSDLIHSKKQKEAASLAYVFIHGLGQHPSCWERTISYLPEHRRGNCPDLPEMLGQKEVTYSNLYDSFAAYCNSLDGPLHLCGLSLGGILALHYAIEYPEKTASLVLINAQYKMPKRLLAFQSMLFRFVPKSTFQGIRFTKKDFIQLTHSMMDLNFSEKLSAVSCASMIVCGQKDRVNRNASRKLAERIPGAELQFIPNAGHEVNIQAPERLAETLEAFYEKHQL